MIETVGDWILIEDPGVESDLLDSELESRSFGEFSE